MPTFITISYGDQAGYDRTSYLRENRSASVSS